MPAKACEGGDAGEARVPLGDCGDPTIGRGAEGGVPLRAAARTASSASGGEQGATLRALSSPGGGGSSDGVFGGKQEDVAEVFPYERRLRRCLRLRGASRATASASGGRQEDGAGSSILPWQRRLKRPRAAVARAMTATVVVARADALATAATARATAAMDVAAKRTKLVP